MRYSTEAIYYYSGQFDKIVSVTFGYGTKSRELYGDFVTAEFYYIKDERIEFEKRLKQTPVPSTDGYVKLVVLVEKLDDEKKKRLQTEGVLASDIVSISQFNEPDENKFTKEEIKELPKPLEIKVDLSDFDNDSSVLWLNDTRIKNGFKLIPEEVHEHNAVLYKLYKDKFKKEDFERVFIDSTTGEVHKRIYYHYLKDSFLKGKITDAQKDEFSEIIKERTGERADILKKELQRSTDKFKELGINYAVAINRIYQITMLFEDERLTHNRFPVWWDYERLIHIYLRHVEGMQVGEKFEEKTVFQYKLRDIKRLVEIVLEKVDDEIQKHFLENKDQDFKRHGTMAVYYNGDYYNIDIGQDGRLMTFYKQDPKEQKKG
jgi:hypothetical protein